MEAIDGDEAAAVLGSGAILTETQDVDLYTQGTASDGLDAAGEASSSKGGDETQAGKTNLPCCDRIQASQPTAVSVLHADETSRHTPAHGRAQPLN